MSTRETTRWSRRRSKKWSAQHERHLRHARKVKSCDPRRLWPLDHVLRQDFEVTYCGDFNRVLKWHYGDRDRFIGRPDRIEALVFDHSPFFAMIQKVAVLA